MQEHLPTLVLVVLVLPLSLPLCCPPPFPCRRKWYAVLGPSSNASGIDQGVSLNAHLIQLPATDTHAFQDNFKVRPAALAGAAAPTPTQLPPNPNRCVCPWLFCRLPQKVVDWTAVIWCGQAMPSCDCWLLTAYPTPVPRVQVCYIPGVTLLIDFPFPAFPDNLGHWAELLLPLYSALSSSRGSNALQQILAGQQQQHIDRLLLLNVRQQLLYNWPKEVLGLALAPALPPWPQQQQQGDGTDSSSTGGSTGSSSRMGWHEVLPWDRPLPPIINPADYEGWAMSGWMVFENMVVLQDRCGHKQARQLVLWGCLGGRATIGVWSRSIGVNGASLG